MRTLLSELTEVGVLPKYLLRRKQDRQHSIYSIDLWRVARDWASGSTSRDSGGGGKHVLTIQRSGKHRT